MKLQKDLDKQNLETELKLQIDAAYIDQLLQHSLLEQNATSKPRHEQITSTYYDTPDFMLKRRGASLRLRQLEDGWVQTLKAGDTVSTGLHQRNEWEGPVDAPSLNIGALCDMLGPHTDWCQLLRHASLLHPLFTTVVNRTVWDLQFPAGDAMELALDQGWIEYEALKEPISEVEMELKSGEPKNLFDCALQLFDHAPIRIENLSKADRGYALCMPL